MAKPTLPPGFEDEQTFLAAAREDYRVDAEADKTNRDAALDDLKFACDYREGPSATHGAQWDDTVVQERAGRPCLTNNVLPQYIGQIVGDNRINRPAIKVRPAEDADEELAEVRAGIIRYIEAQSNAQWIYTTALQAQATCGIGHFRVGLDYADNGSFLRDIRIKPIANPLSVIWDRLSVERTGRDAKRCFITDAIPRKDFEKQWPDAMPGGFALGEEQQLLTDGWMTQDMVRVCEYWRMEGEERTLAQMPDGSVADITDGLPEGMKRKPKETRKITRMKACMWLITGFSVLEGPFEVPIDRIPVFRAYGRLFFVGDARVWFGLVRFMKDPQRLQNYADSVIAESLALAPKQHWLADAQAVEGREETIRQAHRSGDPLMVKNTGGEMERIDPAPVPIGFLQWRQLLTQQMKDISGLHDASLGIASNETSGKAINARKVEGDIATIEYHDNLNAAIAEGGRVINELIPVVYDTPRQIRIVGDDEAMSVIKVNDPKDPKSHDMSQGKYDIVVETGPSYSTKLVEAAEGMTAFVQAFPPAAPFIGDLMARAQGWPDADKVADRLKAMIPPEAQDKPDPEDMSPEEQEQFAQQQEQETQDAATAKQLQEQMAKLGLEEKSATIANLKATAAKTQADAERMQAETAKIMAEAQSGQSDQPHPDIEAAEVRKAMAGAEQAESNAEAAQWNARTAQANAMKAEAEAHIGTLMTAADAAHTLEHGRGITDPDPAAKVPGE